METKFTPGPWVADGIFICDNDDNNVCICEQDNWEPDSYLIAAAPELYEALEQLLDQFDSEIRSEYGGTSMLESRLAEADYARAALAKARGEA
jgi:hypothetical protein